MLYLRDGRRVADVVKSPSRPRASATYAVTEAGVRGVRGGGAAGQGASQASAGAGSIPGTAAGTAPGGSQGGERGGEPPPKMRRH